MNLPDDLQRLIYQAREAVKTHPQNELIRANREKFFELFRTSYTKTGKWLAILTARKVQHIFEEKWKTLFDQDSQFIERLNRKEIDVSSTVRHIANGHLSVLEDLYYYLQPNSGKYVAKRMIDIAEDVVNGQLVEEYALWNANNFYWNLFSSSLLRDPKNAYYAFWAAYQALLASYENKPFEYKVVFIPINDPDSKITADPKYLQREEYKGSIELGDEYLIQERNMADFPIYAAFAYAYEPNIKSPNATKLREFWEWWLKEAIPQAWVKANVLDESE